MSASSPQPFAADHTLVIALQGWSDAGEAASRAVTTVGEEFSLDWPIARFDDEQYYDYASQRPRVTLDATTGSRVLSWPGAELRGPEPGDFAPGQPRRYVLVGEEPALRWKTYVRELLAVCAEEGIRSIVIVGALLADAPHSRDIEVALTSDDASVREELGVDASRYEGPTGVPGVLGVFAKETGIRVLSMWAKVPHYTATPDNASPKAELALLDELSSLLEFEFDRTLLADAAEAWEQQISDEVEGDENLTAYVRFLEQARDVVDSESATGDAIAAEFEQFLATNHDAPGDDQDVDGESDR